MQEETLEKIKKGIRYTNCFLSMSDVEEKILNNKLEVVHDTNFLGLLEKSEYDFSYLYFYIQNNLEFHLKTIQDKNDIVLDVIFAERKKEKWQPILNKFYKNNFKKHASFDRMFLTNPSKEVNYKNDQVTTPKEQDFELIKSFLEQNFDVYAERIPTIKELEKLSKTTYLIKKDEEIAALLISEKNGLTEELRYWLVNSKYRGKGFGGILMRYFFNNYEDTKRFLLWVQKDNVNAIEKYQYFGFKKDKLNMYILKR